jgi:hypothetical protein
MVTTSAARVLIGTGSDGLDDRARGRSENAQVMPRY